MRYIKAILPMICITFVALFFAGCTLQTPTISQDPTKTYMISWDKVGQAKGYEVYVGRDNFSVDKNENSVNLIRYLQKGNIDSVKIKAVSGSYFYSSSKYSNELSIKVLGEKLPIPTNLKATAANNIFDFSWDPVENANGYCLRLVDSENKEQYFYSDTNSFNPTGKINSGGEITLTVFAFANDIKKFAPSDYSESVTFVNDELLDVPTNTKLMKVGANFRYTWNSVKNASKYNISLLNDEQFTSNTNKFSIAKSLAPGEAMFVSVQALSNTNYSAYSDVCSYYTNGTKEEYSTKKYSFNGQEFDFVADSKEELEKIIHFGLYYRITSVEYFANYAGYQNKDALAALNSYEEIKYVNFSNPPLNNNGRHKIIISYKHPNYPTKIATGNITPNQNEKVKPTSLSKTPRSPSFDGFKINTRENNMMVYSSDQLYYAIQKGYKPIFPSGDSPASAVYNEAKKVLRQIVDDTMNDYQKVLAVFDWLCYNVKYDHNALNIVNQLKDSPEVHQYRCFYIEGVLLDGGLAVCDGIGKTFALLCGIEDIESYKVSGTANNCGHAWNKVKIDLNEDGSKEWYTLDATWNDITDPGTYRETLTHTYFLNTDEFLENNDHIETSPKTDVAKTDFDYYTSTKYDGVNSLYVTEKSQLENVCKYIKSNNLDSFEIKTTLTSHTIDILLGSYLAITGRNYSYVHNSEGIYVIFANN